MTKLEATHPDVVAQISTLIRRVLSSILALICLIATAVSLSTVAVEKVLPERLTAIAFGGSGFVISTAAIFSLSLIGRPRLTLFLIIGNVVCLVPALISFLIKPNLLAFIIALWCAAFVVVPLLRIDLWRTKG